MATAASPRFYNQLFSGVDEVAMMGTFVAVATNTSMYTFEMAPAYSLMEAEVITSSLQHSYTEAPLHHHYVIHHADCLSLLQLLSKMRSLIGWGEGEGDGLFSPGGSISNLYGLLVARHRLFPAVKGEGVRALPQMVILASEQVGHPSPPSHPHTLPTHTVSLLSVEERHHNGHWNGARH